MRGRAEVGAFAAHNLLDVGQGLDFLLAVHAGRRQRHHGDAGVVRDRGCIPHVRAADDDFIHAERGGQQLPAHHADAVRLGRDRDERGLLRHFGHDAAVVDQRQVEALAAHETEASIAHIAHRESGVFQVFDVVR